MNEGQLKRLLHYIFCILIAPHHSPCYVKDRVCGLFAKDLERSRIATFGSGKKRVFLSQSCVAWLARPFLSRCNFPNIARTCGCSYQPIDNSGVAYSVE